MKTKYSIDDLDGEWSLVEDEGEDIGTHTEALIIGTTKEFAQRIADALNAQDQTKQVLSRLVKAIKSNIEDGIDDQGNGKASIPLQYIIEELERADNIHEELNENDN